MGGGDLEEKLVLTAALLTIPLGFVSKQANLGSGHKESRLLTFKLMFCDAGKNQYRSLS